MIGCIGGGSYEIPIESGFYIVAYRDGVIARARGGFTFGCIRGAVMHRSRALCRGCDCAGWLDIRSRTSIHEDVAPEERWHLHVDEILHNGV